jgi:hypothetical protein
MYSIGKQEAEVQVLIDRLVKKKGSEDKALLYVVSEIGDENKVLPQYSVKLYYNTSNIFEWVIAV